MNIRANCDSLLARPGQKETLEIKVARGVLSPHEVRVELLAPRHVQGVSAAPIVIPADSDKGTFELSFGQRPGPFNMPLVIRATTMQNGDPVIAETKLELATP